MLRSAQDGTSAIDLKKHTEGSNSPDPLPGRDNADLNGKAQETENFFKRDDACEFAALDLGDVLLRNAGLAGKIRLGPPMPDPCRDNAFHDREFLQIELIELAEMRILQFFLQMIFNSPEPHIKPPA
jgi:hypothetical protein